MTDPATLGHALVGVGAAVTIVSASLSLLHDEGTVVRRIGRAVNAVVGPLTRPLRAFHARLGEPPAERCERRGRHRVNWDGYREVCTCCGRGRYALNVDGVSRTEWVYPDNQWIVPDPIIAPRSPSGVSTLADDLRRSSNAVVEAWVAEANRALDEARYARPIEYGRLGDPLRRVRLSRDD